jgi:hypothetical protein
MWVYQTLGARPDPDAVTARAASHHMTWVTAEAVSGPDVLGREWLKAMRRATTERGLRLGVHGFIGNHGGPKPRAEAEAFARAIDIADADFAIVNAEIHYEQSPNPDSRTFVRRYRELEPGMKSYFSSFGRPQFHAGLDWQAWADGDFLGMPQAYENLNRGELRPRQCVADYARFFARDDIRVTLGCFKEHGHGHLPVERLLESIAEVKGLAFNVFRHGTVTTAELQALSTT